MPIRNSTMSSDEAFRVHRKARLAMRPKPSDIKEGQQVGYVEEADTRTMTLSLRQPHGGPTDRLTAKNAPDAALYASLNATPLKPTDELEKSGHDADRHTARARPKPIEDPAPEASPTRTTEASTGQEDGVERLRLQMALAYPATGASPTFDQLVEVQNEKVAFRLVLGKALETYAASVMDGTFANAPTTYSEGSDVAKTSRMFPKAVYGELVKTLNSTGLLSARAIGTMIGRRALAAFVARDKASG